MIKLISSSRFLFKKVASKRTEPILTNFLSLGFIQGTNFMLGVITFPYLVRTIGIENYGIVTFLQTIMIYFTVLSDYSFSLSATKDVSIARNNLTLLSKIYSEVITTKVLLAFISFILLLISFIFFNTLSSYFLPALLSFTIVIGHVLQPNWFFQGVEKMKFISYINILVRALYAIGIFTLVNSEADYIYVNLISGITTIIGGVISLYVAHARFKVKYTVPYFISILKQLKDGKSIFISNASVTVATSTNIVILSFFVSPLVLGFYSVAEKIFIIFRTFAVILYQVVYPRICILAIKSFSDLSLFLNRLLKVIVATFLPLSLICFVLADYIIFLVSGEYIDESAQILRIICFGPLLAALNIPVAQTMLAYKLNKHFALIVSIAAFLNVTLNFALSYFFQAIGTAISILGTELFITVMLYLSMYKKFPQYSFFLKHNMASYK